MNPYFIRTAIVVLGTHNPSILHWYFLRDLGIVSFNDDEIVDHVCTSAFSSVKYKDGTSFVVEPNKLQVMFEGKDYSGDIIDIQKYTDAYTQNLPYVRYDAIGHNFTLFWETDNPEEFLKDNFVKRSFLFSDEFDPSVVGLTYHYDKITYNIRISLNTGNFNDEEGEKRGVVIDINFHYDLPKKKLEDKSRKEILDKLSRYIQEYSKNKTYVRDLVKRVIT